MSNKELKIYSILLRHFGSQGWWPTTPTGYHARPRVSGWSEQERFEICLGAILTQNTAWTNVARALSVLAERQLLSAQAIAALSPERLAPLIRSSGYFRQKAQKIHTFALYLMRHYSGDVDGILRKPTDQARRELLALHGVGPETADSILLYAGGHVVFVVDAYTRRIGRRLGLFETENYDAVQEFFQKRLPRDAALFNEYHALLVALGKDFCKTKPRCSLCPLLKICPAGKRNLAQIVDGKKNIFI